jgi:hypothetical protein
VEPGILLILPERAPFGCKKDEVKQRVAGKFPWQPNREFAAA